MQAPTENYSFVLDPREIAKMLYRRRLWLILAVVIGVLAAGAAIAVQEPKYKSTATLLIDSQQIPTSLVASPLTTIANERISKIRQQIISRESLSNIILSNGLYQREQQEMTFDEVLDIMREAIAVDLVSASETQGQAGQTIAFTVAFTYTDPIVAQEVTRTLTELFLQEDVRFRTEQATGTASFLARRAEEMRRQLSEIESGRRAIEAQYAGALPHQLGLTAQTEGTLRAEISQIDAESQGLMQQNSLLAAREQELAREPHPDGDALRRAEERLRELDAVYADSYPEVIAARAAVERHRQALSSLPPTDASMIQTEIAAGRARLQTLADRRAQIVAEMGATARRSALAPQASYELTVAEREYDNIRSQYEDLREKQLEAQVTAHLQTEGKGEHFSVVNEASMPHKSDGPRSSLLLVLGLVLGAGAGAVIILGYEFLSGTIHGEATLEQVFGAPPMGVIPVDHEGGSRWFEFINPFRNRTTTERMQYAT